MCSRKPIDPASAGKMKIETKARILPPRLTVIEGLKIITETSATATTIIVINIIVEPGINDRLLLQGLAQEGPRPRGSSTAYFPASCLTYAASALLVSPPRVFS